MYDMYDMNLVAIPNFWTWTGHSLKGILAFRLSSHTPTDGPNISHTLTHAHPPPKQPSPK